VAIIGVFRNMSLIFIKSKHKSFYRKMAFVDSRGEATRRIEVIHTSDEISQGGCIVLGIFCCSEKGQAIPRDGSAGLFHGRRRQVAGEAGTKCRL